MIRLYTAPTPNGRKASIALEELGLPYEVERVNLDAGEQFSPAFLARNPNNKIPVLDDGGLVVWESGAILLHLGERHDPKGLLLPKDAKRRIEANRSVKSAGCTRSWGRQRLRLGWPIARNYWAASRRYGLRHLGI